MISRRTAAELEAWSRGKGTGQLEQIQKQDLLLLAQFYLRFYGLTGLVAKGHPGARPGWVTRMPPCHGDSHLPRKPEEMSQLMHLAPQRRECSLHNSR